MSVAAASVTGRTSSSSQCCWKQLDNPIDCISLLSSCPVCFLTTTATKTNNNNNQDDEKEKLHHHNAMVISWLTPATTTTSQNGSREAIVLMSMNKKRHTASILLKNIAGGSCHFGLSIPHNGMQEIVRNVGSVSGGGGKQRSKFQQDHPTTTTTPQDNNNNKPMSKRAKKKHLQSTGIVPGLRRVAMGCGLHHHNDKLFAVEGTVAHLHCQLISIKDMKDDGDIDDEHYFLQAKIVQAYVRQDYWDPSTRVLSCARTPPPPPSTTTGGTLSFFGSQTFGTVVAGVDRSSPSTSHRPNGHDHDDDINDVSWVCLQDGKQFSRLLYTNPICILTTNIIGSGTADNNKNKKDPNSNNNNSNLPGRFNKQEIYVVDRLTAINNRGTFLFCLPPPLAGTTANTIATTTTTSDLFVPVQGMEDLVKSIERKNERIRLSSGIPQQQQVSSSDSISRNNNNKEATREGKGRDGDSNSSHENNNNDNSALSWQTIRLTTNTGVAKKDDDDYGAEDCPSSDRGNSSSTSVLKILKGCVALIRCRVVRTKTISTTDNQPPPVPLLEQKQQPDQKDSSGTDDVVVIFGQVEHAYVRSDYWDNDKNRFLPMAATKRLNNNNRNITQQTPPPYLKRLGTDSIWYLIPSLSS